MRCLFLCWVPLAMQLLLCGTVTFGRSSLGLLVLQFPRPYSSVSKGSDHTQRACSSQIHFHSTLLLLAVDYLHTLASLFFQFEYRVLHFKKLLFVDFCRDNFEFFINIVEITDFQISVSYDFLINCPTLNLDVPSSWPLVMGISWEDSSDFNEDGFKWSKTHSCWFLFSEVFRVFLPIFPHKMFADEKACEEKKDLQLDSPLLQTSQMHRLRICRWGSHLIFQKLLVLLWTNYDAASLCYCPTVSVVGVA